MTQAPKGSCYSTHQDTVPAILIVNVVVVVLCLSVRVYTLRWLLKPRLLGDDILFMYTTSTFVMGLGLNCFYEESGFLAESDYEGLEISSLMLKASKRAAFRYRWQTTSLQFAEGNTH